ncbi:SpoIIE family protein phosphatase [Actinacidiphila acidipaludis]|uniref:SpoIIE family protein phosphatase n=1 Tax=Actinacidiphila acidipaludis TaxID=2873382 RepID=A0ABS7QHL0_9ACTN|nr:SpoIIE family protein phosphatase [Streptomyces acidipaludis]MBY8882286.1 SpoIIE family protein phosphatase [Streptomyces acidipaludis]
MGGDAPLLVVDSAGRVARWSPAAEELLGPSAGEALGRPLTELLRAPPQGPGDDGGTRRRRRLAELAGGPGGRGLDVRPDLGPDGSLTWEVFLPPAGRTRPGVDAAVLEALVDHAPGGLFVLDDDLRVLSANDAAQHMCGGSDLRLEGRPLRSVWCLTPPEEMERLLRRVLSGGVPPPGQVVPAHLTDGLQHRHLNVSVFPLRDGLGAVVVITDVTARERTRRRFQALTAVRDRVGTTMAVVPTCQELADALVEGFADIAVVEVVESVVRGEEPPLMPLGRDVPLRRAAFGHSGGDYRLQAHPVGDVRALPFPTPYAQALIDLRPRSITLDSEASWVAIDPDRARAIRDSGAHSLLVAPLTVRGTVIGLLSLYRTGQGDGFDEHEVALVSELATHTALSIDNARRFTHEHTIAAALQRHLLPSEPASQTAVETAHLYVAHEEGGGGWFDAFDLPGARTALVVGEVDGHGIHTATVMGQLRTVVNSLASLDLDPDELLARLDDATTRLAHERMALPAGDPLRGHPVRATCVCAVYDPFARTCTLASAGHPAPFVVGAEATVRRLSLPAGPPLGIGDGLPFAATTVTLADGDILGLYTSAFRAAARPRPEPAAGGRGQPEGAPDGPEAAAEALAEERMRSRDAKAEAEADGTVGPDPADGLEQVLAGRERPLQGLCDDVLYRLRLDDLTGDAVLLLARTHPFPDDRVADWELEELPTAASAARGHVRHQLAVWDVSEDVGYATEGIVSELVTNALRYGAPPIRLRLIKDRALTCEVQDSSTSAPRMRHARTIDEGGRGLYICARLAQNWGVRYTAHGKTVWTEQSLTTPPV